MTRLAIISRSGAKCMEYKKVCPPNKTCSASCPAIVSPTSQTNLSRRDAEAEAQIPRQNRAIQATMVPYPIIPPEPALDCCTVIRADRLVFSLYSNVWHHHRIKEEHTAYFQDPLYRRIVHIFRQPGSASQEVLRVWENDFLKSPKQRGNEQCACDGSDCPSPWQ